MQLEHARVKRFQIDRSPHNQKEHVRTAAGTICLLLQSARHGSSWRAGAKINHSSASIAIGAVAAATKDGTTHLQRRIPPLPLDARQIVDKGSSASAAVVGTRATNSSNATTAQAPLLPDLLPQQMNASDRAKWTAVGQLLWDALVHLDLDFVDTNGSTIPPGPNATIQTPRQCGRIARVWVRMPFHDCGTFNAKTGKGGCNGSLRKELPATEPLLNVTTGQVVFNDVFDELGNNKSRADVEFDPSRMENQGFAVSTSFFFQVKFAAEGFGLQASWADIQVYAGLLSIAICQGPRILFVPGRVDSVSADPAGLLPAPSESLANIIGFYQWSGLGLLNGIAVQASHSVACFAAGCLDDTPNRLDNLWARDLLSWNLQDLSDLCVFPASIPTSKPRCYAPFDAQFLTSPTTRNILQLLAANICNPQQLTRAAAFAAGPFAGRHQSGLLWGVNLCSPTTCDESQWSFFHLFATAYYRLTSLGLPEDWPGFSTDLTAGAYGSPLQQPAGARSEVQAAAGTEYQLQNDYDKTATERQKTQEAWKTAYDFAKAQCILQ